MGWTRYTNLWVPKGHAHVNDGLMLKTDGFVSWNTKKKSTHEYKTSQDHLQDGSNDELTLKDRKQDLCSHTNVFSEVKVYT
jgi:hypothetical protein